MNPSPKLRARPAAGLGPRVSKALGARYRHWRRRIFGVTWLAYAGLYLTRKSFSVAKVELRKPEVMGLTTGQMSWIDSGYSLAYALGQFAWGSAGDRAGTRAVVLAGMLGSVVVGLLMGAATGASVFGVLMVAQGFCQASGWAPLSKNVGEFFSRPERGSVMGFWSTNYATGGFIASAVAGFAAQRFGWRGAFLVPAGCLLGIWVLFLLLQRDRPADAGLPPIEAFHGLPPDEADGPGAGPASGRAAAREALRDRMVWLLACVYFLIKPTRYLIIFWAPVFINERLGTGVAASGLLGSAFELAGPLGTLAGGLVSDRVFGARRMPASVLALLLLAGLMAGYHLLPPTKLALGGGLFVIGFLIYIPDSLVSGTAAIDFGSKRGASTASGLINGFGSIGQIAGVSMPGWIGRFMAPGAEIWGPIFSCLAVSLFLAGLLLIPQWNRLPAGAARSGA